MRVQFKLRHSNRAGAVPDERRDEVLTGDVVHIHDEFADVRDQQFVVTVPNWLGGHTVAGRHLLTINGLAVPPTEPERATTETVTDEQLTTLYRERDDAVARHQALVRSLVTVAQMLVVVLQNHETPATTPDPEEPTDDA